ncbi:TolC family protein [Desulforamulus putei]|uniref:TolC family protein n=1 Tax=Desulforamulus putei TaxID=74701 RepID=UPI002FDCAE84
MRKLLPLIILFCSLFVFSYSAYGNETGTVLSLEEAIKKAMQNSITLKNDQVEIEKKDILFKDASSLIQYTPVDISFNPSDTNLFKYFYGAEYEKRKAEKKLENDRRQLIIDVKSKYYNVIASDKKLKALELSEKKAQIQLLQAQAKYKVGLITKAELSAAEAKVATENAILADAKAKLDNAYSEFNKAIGAPLDSKPILKDLPIVEKKELDINEQMNMAASNSYEMWSAEEGARLTDRLKLFEKFYDIGDYNVDQAKNTLVDSRQEIKNQTRKLCMSINYLYEKNNELEQQISQYQEILKVAKVQWETGIATRDTVLNAEYALQMAEASQLEVASAYVTALDTLSHLTGKEPNY